jgi:ADP-heptose:LPS heptosyltransferase
MKYFCLFQSYGDNLISLCLLNQIKNEKINILGTKLTLDVAKLMGFENRFNIIVIYDKIPSFYNLRKDGVIRATKDFFNLIKFLLSNNIEMLFLDKKDFRSFMISLFVKIKVPIIHNENTYFNRSYFFESIFNKKIVLKSSLNFNGNKKILISGLTSRTSNNIRIDDFAYIIEILKSNKYISITLIDLDKSYSSFSNLVDCYHTNTSLDDVKSLILEHDFYIGPDSFLIHLAYFLETPFCLVLNHLKFSFLPPSTESNQNYIFLSNNSDNNNNIKNKLSSLNVIT